MKTGIAPENRKRSHDHGTHQHPRPRRGPQRRRHRDDRCPAAGRQPRSGRPGRPVGRARRGGRRGDRRARRHQHGRRPAGPDRAREERHRHPHQGQPARHRRHLDARRPGSRRGPARRDPRAGSTADAGQPAPVPASGTADGGEAAAGPAQEPDPAVTAEAAGNVLALAQAADEAGKALASGDWTPPWPPWTPPGSRPPAGGGRRALKAAASGRRAPATRPGALRDLVEEHLRKFPGTAFTPHQVGKVLTRSADAVANALDKLTGLGVAQMVTDKPRSYRLAPAAPARDGVSDPGTSAEAAPSARCTCRVERTIPGRILPGRP
jgi:hypothetical protein